jgi:hypothetical protein
MLVLPLFSHWCCNSFYIRAQVPSSPTFVVAEVFFGPTLVVVFTLVLFLFPWLLWYFPPSCPMQVNVWSTKLINRPFRGFFLENYV